MWAAQHTWCAPPQGDPEPRPHSAGPTRPRSADPLRHRLDVPVDAGMAALGFLSDDAQPTGLSLAATFCHCVSMYHTTQKADLRTQSYMDSFPNMLLCATASFDVTETC